MLFRSLHPVYPQTGNPGEYRRRWLGKMIERYRDTATKIIFIRLPRGPVVRPGNPVVNPNSSIREFAKRLNVFLVDEHFFDSLEHSEFFQDAQHLNHDGLALFSPMLAKEVARILGPPHSGAPGQR